ncbi:MULTISPECIES: hypothetical protein [Moorena]|uniref:Uncharacterized protein n=1 Tax=Moorena producens 3L TaxID=489825 RepID=F4XNK6_9CYAN|nr:MULTISPECIES: hypothetical protein [Moorena]EGJ34265.1 hypothetical protein LYNGBM3L_24460 [Moorena producens 3L]NEP69155.1 hypothetical protein [Moorena sp. SIO3A5]OLT65793.1 hypothetical protein BI334_12780 [Moorena producens 3L]
MTTLVKNQKIYDEFINFIAQGTSPESVTNFKYSEATKEQIDDLVERAKLGDLSPSEKNELEQFLVVEHLIRLTKARAHQYLKSVF